MKEKIDDLMGEIKSERTKRLEAEN